MTAKYGYFFIDSSENPLTKNAASKGRKIYQDDDGTWILTMKTADNNAIEIEKMEELLQNGGDSFAIETSNGEKTYRVHMNLSELNTLITALHNKQTRDHKFSFSLNNGTPNPSKEMRSLNLEWEKV